MSYENLEKALELAKKLPDYMHFDNCSDKAMDELEDYLGFELSKQHYDFLRNGSLGVYCFDFIGSYEGMCDCSADVKSGMELDKKHGLKVDYKYVPLLEEDEWTNYLNYNKLTKDGEPTVVYAFPSPDEFIIFEQTNQDLGDFLLKLFTEIQDNLDE